MNKRNPRLVPYVLLDEKTKKTNRDSVNNAVRTLIGYGYNIEPPDQEISKFLCCLCGTLTFRPGSPHPATEAPLLVEHMLTLPICLVASCSIE